ncbi:hypothetical protein GGR25_003495 [Kaistia hirudinis]|uniref:Uncharacterized protein n=1 Tax=Kaistia hirudinis TaxID=1293440 RepID=A0A840ATQ0_9HYPH|nr:hypothetical protein [Kaistia hirudinis]MBB3932437.1 hypothetical protein [Kaistia hirudinis]
MPKAMVAASIVVGMLFVILAGLYWAIPAGSLPAWMPGFEVGSTHIHFKHGLGSFILGLAIFAFAWFRSGPNRI